MKAAAIICWFVAWCFAGLIPAAFFAARADNARVARIDLASGIVGAAGFGVLGAVLW